jgi:hypothetical protein
MSLPVDASCISSPDEYPDTGLTPHESVGVIDSIVWPFRHYLRRRLNLLPVASPVVSGAE